MNTRQPVKPLTYAGPIQQAVDDYLLMERKARAWDELRAYWAALPDAPSRMEVARMDQLVHPAQEPSAR